MSTNNLSPAGSGSYSSPNMYVGDGTWDNSRNTFLLPNLQGLNLATTQYNGMGNRFRNMVGYRSVVRGHGIVAAITFLFVVPAAIFMARFYHRNPRMALRIHIWLQILTVFLSTSVFILGFQAVGSRRSLSNPHHGIGVALYTLVLVQAFGGCMIHRIEKGKERYKIPLKLMLHQWIGRAIALLGIAQVALGLTLYGSPKWTFILFAVWGFVLLVAYFILSYKNQPEIGFDDRGTYITERTESSRRTNSRRGHGLGALAAAGAAGAGIAALRRRSRSRSRRRPSGGNAEVLSSSGHSSRESESYFDEKHSEHGRKENTWRNRLLGAAAAGAGIAAVRSMFNRNKKPPPTETGSDVSYSRPLGPSSVTQTDLTRLEEGRAPASPANDRYRRAEESEHPLAAGAIATGSPRRHGHGHRPADSRTSIDSWEEETTYSEDPKRHNSHGMRNTLGALGAIGFLKYQWYKRRNKKDEAREEEMRRHDMEAERRARLQNRRYTGDGSAPPPRRHGRQPSFETESDISGMTPALSRHNIPPPPMNTGGASTAASNIPPPPMHPAHETIPESGSESYLSPGGNPHRRHHSRPGPSSGSLAVPGASASRRGSNAAGSGVNSPPISVKVKMHGDGRHVTLRRLNEEEAAAAREARRRENGGRNGNGGKKGGSVSSVGGGGFDNERWRRAEAIEREQAQQMEMDGQHQAQQAQGGPVRMPEPSIPGPPPIPPPPNASASPMPSLAPSSIPPPPSTGPAAPMPSIPHPPLPQHPGQGPATPGPSIGAPSYAGSQYPGGLPPPPPIPAVGSGMSSPLGTGTYGAGTETDVSAYDSNRRRRRAERAQAKARLAGGKGVEFQ